MRILVTGGAGFIGSHVVDACLEAGHEVAAVDSLWPHGGGRRSNVNPRAQLFILDIRDAALADVFARFAPDVVSHHAAQHSVALSTRDPGYDADVNVRGLLNVLQLSRQHGVRKFVFASSAATYGSPRYLPIDETHPQAPESPYGITKLAGEHYARYFAADGGPRYTALRYGNVYGPRQDPSGEAGVIAIFASRILEGKAVRIDWDGEQQRDYVFVGDVARANLMALEAADGEAVNIGTGVGTSVNSLYSMLCEAVGRRVDVERAPKRPGDVSACVFDVARARAVLGWSAQTPLAEGLAATVNFFRSALSR